MHEPNSNMILRDPCRGTGSCGPDGLSFKGMFAQNLANLHSIAPKKHYAEFLKQNAASLWDNSRDRYNRLGLAWTGPFAEPAHAGTQCSGMDILVGALAQLGEWSDQEGEVGHNIMELSAGIADKSVGEIAKVEFVPYGNSAGRSARRLSVLWWVG